MKQVTFFLFLACLYTSNAFTPTTQTPVTYPPHHHERPVWRILKSNYDLDPSGAYNFNYETENGIRQDEVGSLKTISNGEDALEVRGSYSYQAPNGQTITVVYYADENGFHAEGEHIPVPDAIHRNIKQIPIPLQAIPFQAPHRRRLAK